MKNIRPLSDFIVVKKIEPKSETDSGIFIPLSMRELSNKATVCSTGPGKRNEKGTFNALPVKKDDIVLFNIHAARELGDDYMLLRENDIFAVESQ